VTEPTTVAPEDAQVEEKPWSPFPDQETAQFYTEKEIRQVQLHAELEKALDQVIQISSARTPGEAGEHLWIVPATVDSEVVEQVLADHEPDPNWGVPQSTRDWFDIQRRVMEDPEVELSAEEMQTVLKGLLLRQIGQ
jgi:hypothetical protein